VLTQARIRFELLRARLRRQGVLWLAGRLLVGSARAIGWVVLLPATLILHLAGWRRVLVFTDRIGHLAAEVDCFLKAKALGELPARRWFILAPPHRVSNRTLLEYWKPHIRVVTSPWLCTVLGAMSRWPGLMSLDASHYVLRLNATAEYFRICAEWGDRPPLLRLSEADRKRGRDALASMGVPHGAWFVCVQAREGGFSPVDEALHSHRNSDVGRLLPAMAFIVSQGGWCVRMGDPTTTPLPPLANVIDYAHHSAKSDWMDVFLCASCRFFLGNSSGLAIVSNVFGVPCALANMVPLSNLSYAPRDISIPKLLRAKDGGRYISFEEAFRSPLANYRLARLYEEAGVEVEENSGQEMLGLASEMLERVNGTRVYSDADEELQRRFHSLLRPGHYGYGSASRIGADFLATHRDLFSSAAAC